MAQKKSARFHPGVYQAADDMRSGKLSRRDFVRIAALLGVSAPVAYSLAGCEQKGGGSGGGKSGGNLRVSMRVQDMTDPAKFDWTEQSNIARQVLEFLQLDLITNALNVPSVNADLLKMLRPCFELAERMGLFMSQYRSGRFKQVSIEYAGTVATHPLELLTAAFLKGLLRPVLGEQVNDVNAPHLAREHGIRVSETRVYSATEFASSIHVKIEGDQGSYSLSGALFGQNDYRLVRIDDYLVEAVPEGHLLVLHNEDRPGVIARISGILADAEVNIAMLNLSRRRIEGTAISLIGIDSALSPEVLQRLTAADGVLFACPVNLPPATNWNSN